MGIATKSEVTASFESFDAAKWFATVLRRLNGKVGNFEPFRDGRYDVSGVDIRGFGECGECDFVVYSRSTSGHDWQLDQIIEFFKRVEGRKELHAKSWQALDFVSVPEDVG